MTERLYYDDAYRTTFEARVLRIEHDPDRTIAYLDRTAFYPTSGGQPFDTGRLGDATVLEVVESADGGIAHLIDRPIVTDSTVRGHVDWGRRFDHMQQHTGQHILSAAFVQTCQAETVGVHLGQQSSTIDLDRIVGPDECRAGEDVANATVWRDRPVLVRFADAAEAASMPLRKASAREGRLRLVDIEDVDLSACGGTHVSRTGEVGAIGVLRVERYKGGSRLEFACGGRAVHAFRQLRDAVIGATQRLSVLPGELPSAIDRLQAENKAAVRQRKALQARLTGFEADALTRRASEMAGCAVVIETLEGHDAASLKELGMAIAGRAGHVAVLLSASPPVVAVVASARDTPVDAGALVRALTARFGGRGGGRRAVAQAGGLDASPDAIATFARQTIASAGR